MVVRLVERVNPIGPPAPGSNEKKQPIVILEPLAQDVLCLAMIAILLRDGTSGVAWYTPDGSRPTLGGHTFFLSRPLGFCLLPLGTSKGIFV